MHTATSTMIALLITIALIASTQGRIITFRNSCPFAIDVEKITNGEQKIEHICVGLGTGRTCTWTIPFNGWAGNFHRRNTEGGNTGFPSGTLAEFAFPNLGIPSQWNMDFFDISIIPPGCPGTIFSYDGCWCNGGSDGYDVGMVMKPLRCLDKTRTCKGRYCNDAYLFPKDDSKTTACTDTNTDWEVEFCPAGSHIDLNGRGLTSQTAPCRGGPNPSPPPGQNPNPNPPPPPPPSGGKCNIENGIDYFGSDISNRPAGSADECCNHCSSVSGCAAWTLAFGVCYMKNGNALSNRVSNSAVVSGSIRGNVGAPNPTPKPNPPPPPPPPPPKSGPAHCSQPCEVGGFAGRCTSNCPPCYIASGSGWNCFGKDNGRCPDWPGMTDCSGARAEADDSATFGGQSSPANSNSIIIGLSVGIVVLVVALVVVVLIAISNAKKSKVETV